VERIFSLVVVVVVVWGNCLSCIEYTPLV